MSQITRPDEVPRWLTHVVVPGFNLLLAFVLSGILIAFIGENPFRALTLLIKGAFVYGDSLGFTLYYTTNFMFTGLAVAIAFHCGLFNIGGEGQAYVSGLGVALVGLYLGHWPVVIVIPLGIMAAALFGGVWGVIPGYLQAKRGSHVVITTIMFNFIAAALMTYLLVEVLIKPGQQSPESREFASNIWLPFAHDVVGRFGINMLSSPLNFSFIIAIIVSVLTWGLIWHTRWGYEMRTVGQNPTAAVYAGISTSRNIILAMFLSGAVAGGVGINEIMGIHHRLLLDFTSGFGFVGIAVALMGRSHPFGIFLAALLFGILFQGGTELSFDMPRVNRDMVVVIQGLVILFSGAMESVFRPHIIRLFMRSRAAVAAPAE